MKIKLLYPPKFYDNSFYGSYAGNLARVPLISLPVLTSFLRQRGFEVDQDDLDVIVHEDNKKGIDELQVDMSLFNDRARIIDFLRSGSASELEAQGRRILAKTDYHEYDIIGFSIISEWNFSGIASTLVLAKLIQEETEALIARHYPNVPLKKRLTGYETLVSHQKATRMLGYRPRYTWRESEFNQWLESL